MTRAAKILARNPSLKKQMDEAKPFSRRRENGPTAVHFRVQIRAVPLERHRHHGGGTYLPIRSRKFRETIQAWMRIEMRGRAPMSGPIAASFRFYFARPKTGPNSKGSVRHCIRPDLSNLVKAVEDAANGILWNDDAQLCDVSASKTWCPWWDIDAIEVSIREYPQVGAQREGHV